MLKDGSADKVDSRRVDSRRRIGIDLGGSKIEGVVLGADGAFGERRRTATPGDYEGVLSAICELTATLETDLPSKEASALVGLCAPGSSAPQSGLMRNSNCVHLNGKPFIRDLEARLQRPLRCANDADCFALSEAADGAAQDGRIVFGVIMGTGVGGGVTIDGRLIVGVNRISGEWGHIPLPWPKADEIDGPLCYCGLRGCMETWVSGPALAADHRRRQGQDLTPVEIVARAQSGDRKARQSLQRHHDRVARGLAAVCNILDPDIIVLGGGLSNMPSLYRDLPALMEPYVFTSGLRTRIRRHYHGDSSGVRGAARLWPDTATN